MKRRMFKNSDKPLIAINQGRVISLFPAKNRLKNFFGSFGINKTLMSHIQIFGALIAAFSGIFTAIEIGVAWSAAGSLLGIGTTAALVSVFNPSVFALSAIVVILASILKRIAASDNSEDVFLAVKGKNLKYFENIDEELVHKYYESKMKEQGLNDDLLMIQNSLDKKNLTEFLRKDLLKKHNEIKAELSEASEVSHSYVQEIRKAVQSIVEIEDLKNNKSAQSKADAEAMKVLSLLSKDADKDAVVNHELALVEEAENRGSQERKI